MKVRSTYTTNTAVTRIGGEVEPGLLRYGIAPLGLGGQSIEADKIEAVDGLRLAIFEDLEVLRLQAFDNLAVLDRIRIDADQARPSANQRALLRLRRRWRLR